MRAQVGGRGKVSIGRSRGVCLFRVSSGVSVESLGAGQGVVQGRGSD